MEQSAPDGGALPDNLTAPDPFRYHWWFIRMVRFLFGGRYMDKKRLEHFKAKLQQKQQDLMLAVSRNEQDGRLADEEATQDVADKALNSYTKEFLFHQSNTDRTQLQLVVEALGRIRDGSFGECVTCGEEINSKRLEAVPWARYCLTCQEKVEQGVLT